MQTVKRFTGDLHFMNGGGEMGKLMRSFDWSKTSVGAPEEWLQSLRTTVSIILNSSFPMFLFWGKDLLCFYNDAYRPSLGNNGKHPVILGMKAADAWPEIWDFIKPLIDQVLAGKGAVWFEDQHLPIFRNGKMENVYWTFSYSAVSDESGKPAGVFVTCTETTDKVVNTLRLKDNEERLRFAFDAAYIGSWELDLTTMTLNASDRCKINFGKPLNQPFTYQQLQDAIHPDDFKRQQKTVASVIKTGADYDIEYRVIWHDNSVHWINIRGKLRYDKDNNPAAMIGISSDITKQKNAENILKESEQRFQNLVRQATVGIIVLNGEEMHVSMVNDGYGKLINRTYDELINKKLFEIIPETEAYFRPIIDNVRITGEPLYLYSTPYTVNSDEGIKQGYLNLVYQPYKETDGSITGVMVLCQDVTEQVNARKELEKAFEQARLSKEAAQLGTFDMNLEKGTMEWDERCRTLFGISHKDAVSYEKDFVTGLHPEDRERILNIINNTFIKSISDGDYDVEYRTIGAEDELIRWIKAKGKVYFDKDDNPFRFIGSVLDITEQINAVKKIEETVIERTKELAEANYNLQKSNEELAQFAYIASHDLQEPLRKISTYSQMLTNTLKNNVSDESANYISKIKTSSEKMTKLIRDILNYSQLIKENETFDKVDLSEIFKNIITDFDLLIEQKQATVKYNNLPVIEAIPLQMSQLFSNLLGNALKFARKDVKPVIKLNAESLSPEEIQLHLFRPGIKYFKLQFIDNGIGIQPEYTRKIFNIFQRLHGKSEYEGTGIGLAMCKKIALNHNGDIYAEGNSNGGATFTIILPVKHMSL